MIDGLHHVLNLVIGGPYSYLAWAGVRALTVLCALFASGAVRKSQDRWLVWSSSFLAVWVSLKVADDVLVRQPSTTLTVYFLLSNLAWDFILLGLARMANRERGKK